MTKQFSIPAPESAPGPAKASTPQQRRSDVPVVIARRQQHRLRTLYALVAALLVGVAIWSSPLFAQTDDSKAGSSNESGVFEPSEEISEDFAVPFPVDI